MVTSLAAFQFGIIRAARMVLLLHHFDDRPRRGTSGSVRGLGEILCSRSVHSLEVPQGQNYSWILLHVRIYVPVDLVSLIRPFGHMLCLLIISPETAVGTLTTTPTFRSSTSKASPMLATS